MQRKKYETFDILEFIDSDDIREYNSSTHFYPVEKAVLIYYSRKHSVEDKIHAWKTLLEAYSEDEFQETAAGKVKLRMLHNRKVVENTLMSFEKALEVREITEGVVYEAEFWECNYPDSVYPIIFSSYDKAYAYLQKEKQEYLDDENLKLCKTEGKITRHVLDEEDKNMTDITYVFDDNLTMTDIRTRFSEDEELGDVSIYIPLPFKKGDIVKSLSPGKVEYGVISCDPEQEKMLKRIQHGECECYDMWIAIEFFYKCEGKWEYGHDHCNPLMWEKCSPKELKDEQHGLELLSLVYKGEMGAGQLLNLYSQFLDNGKWLI